VACFEHVNGKKYNRQNVRRGSERGFSCEECTYGPKVDNRVNSTILQSREPIVQNVI